jgi:hypothetical protein
MNSKLKKGFVQCELLGQLKRPSKYKLYKYKDLVWFFINYKIKLLKEVSKLHIKSSKIAELVKIDVLKLWNRSNLPMLSDIRIKMKIEAFYNKYKMLLARKKNGKLQESAIIAFKSDIESVFNICQCKCDLNSACTCSCNMTIALRESWKDQNTDRVDSLDCNIK